MFLVRSVLGDRLLGRFPFQLFQEGRNLRLFFLNFFDFNYWLQRDGSLERKSPQLLGRRDDLLSLVFLFLREYDFGELRATLVPFEVCKQTVFFGRLCTEQCARHLAHLVLRNAFIHVYFANRCPA